MKLFEFFKNKIKKKNTEKSGKEARGYSEEEFLAELAAFDKAYLTAVIISAIIAAAGIAVAVTVKVSYGLICAISAVLFYVSGVSNILYGKLGISYTSVAGALTVTKYHGKNKEEAWIPRRLMWIDVRSIEDKAFDNESCREIKTVHLPATLKYIGENVFLGCENISRICFEGSREEWEAIECRTELDGIEIEFDSVVAYPKKEKLKDRQKTKKDKKDKKVQKDK